MDIFSAKFSAGPAGRRAVLLTVMIMAIFWALSPIAAGTRKPAGFYDGSLLLTGTSGTSLHTGGSLLKMERKYNDALRSRAEAGLVNFSWKPLRTTLSDSARIPVTRFESETKDISDFSVEVGVTDNLGLGLMLAGYEVSGRQQDSFPSDFSLLNGSPTPRTQTVFPAPMEYKLFKGNALLGTITYHFSSHSRVDPYVSLRLGMTRFTSEAHASLDYDPNRVLQKSSRGTAPAAGAGLGMNIFISPEVGFRLELSVLAHRLKTDAFSRGLHSSHMQAGMFFNIDGMQ